MSEHDDLVQDAEAHNIGVFMENEPRLTYDYTVHVVARDSEHGLLFVGGLGCFGVGQMWVADREWFREIPGYDTAPEKTAPEREWTS